MKSLLGAFLAILGCCMATTAQQPAVSTPTAVTPSTISAGQAEAVRDDNAFAIDLYHRLGAQPGNLFFSPASISTAFAMAYAGARGETASEMARVLHYTLPPEQLHPAMGALAAAMNGPHAGYELHSANALWAQKDLSLLPDYLQLTQTDYAAGLRRADFRHAPEPARLAINDWVAQQTNNKIVSLLAPGTVKPDTRLILTNAIYFKGAWEAAFETSATRAQDFHLTAAQSVPAPFMHRTGGYRYYQGDAFQALELPYQGGDLAMLILLPNKIDGLPALEDDLTPATIDLCLKQLQFAMRVNLSLPRFTVTQQFELSQTLAAMGMPRAFGNEADFSGMAGQPDIRISAAIHKAFVDVNETGTEAAAATAIGFRATAVRIAPPPIPFTADHPFLFLIYDKKSESILFLGRVADPASGEKAVL